MNPIFNIKPTRTQWIEYGVSMGYIGQKPPKSFSDNPQPGSMRAKILDRLFSQEPRVPKT